MTFLIVSSLRPLRSSTKVIGIRHAFGMRVVRTEEHPVGAEKVDQAQGSSSWKGWT